MTPPTTTLAAVEGAVITIVVELTLSIEEIVHVPLAHVAAAHTACQPHPQPGANKLLATTRRRAKKSARTYGPALPQPPRTGAWT